jgi:hypothetical protein
MKMSETYQARIVRVGFDPSPQLEAAVGRFVGNQRGELHFQSTAHRAVDLDNGENIAQYEEAASHTEKGLRGLGRHALMLAPGVGMQDLPHALRLFLNVAESEMLDETVDMMRHIDGVDVRPRFNGIFADLAKTAIGAHTHSELSTWLLRMRSDLIDPEVQRGLVVQNPRLVVRDVRVHVQQSRNAA